MNKEEKKKLFKGIRRSNKKFDSGTKAEKRVMIAKDILKYVDSQIIQAKAGKYVTLSEAANLNYTASAQEELHKIPKCNVCALGSMAYAHVVRKNECSLGSLNLISQYRVKESVRHIFSNKQLSLIECAFESSDIRRSAYYLDISQEARSKAINFRNNNDCPKYRGNKKNNDPKALELIMKNIIKNKGTFKP